MSQQIAAEIKAMYVDDFFSADSSEIILGDAEAEQELFDYAQKCGYNYLILYGLSAVPLGSQPESVEALRSFVRRAHEDYEIKLGCVGQSSGFFERIHEKYQSLIEVDSIERLDSYNLEFEFWKSFQSGIYQGYYCEEYLQPNGYSCDSIGAFEFAMDELNKIDSIAQLLSDPSVFEKTSEINTEIYIGWINEYHAEVLAEMLQDSIIDRILGAVYKPPLEDGSLNLYNFYHQLRRMGFLGSQGNSINFLPIFAVKESEDNHLGDWMDTIGSIPYVWDHYQSEFLKDTAAYTENINLQGYVWYNHSNMPLCFDELGDEGNLEGPEGVLMANSVYSFRVSNFENANRFYWELPEGVEFAESTKWDEEVQLKFTSSFQQGDFISVRPANRCHLGENQVFLVNEFNSVSENDPIEMSLIISHHQLLIYVSENSKWDYSIHDLMGKQLKNSTFIGNQASIDLNNQWSKSWYIISLSNGKEMIQQKFLFKDER